MNNRLEKYLYKKYPSLFQDHSKPMNETCMCWGCLHGDGWFLLLDKLCLQITNHITGKNEQVDWYDKWEQEKLDKGEKLEPRPEWVRRVTPVHFNQVIEKFGCLRIYYSGGDETVSTMISFAESMSRYICEECGKFDTTVGSTTKGWIHNICYGCCGEKEDSNDWKLFDINRDASKLMEKVKKDREKNKNKPFSELVKKLAEVRSRSKKK